MIPISKKSICVFCSSSPHVEDRYKKLAAETGKFCAEQGWNVVYGGAAGGLMGIMAEAALEGGAQVTGVMPECLSNQERAHQKLPRLIITKSLHERQKIMADLSDIFLVLPGGLGTLAEFFEVLTWKQIGLHEKPIYVMNSYGYWDHLLGMLDAIQTQKFLHRPKEDLMRVIQAPADLAQINENLA